MTSADQVSKLVTTQYGWTFSPSMTSVPSMPWSAGETNFIVMGKFILVFLYYDLWTETWRIFVHSVLRESPRCKTG